MPFVLMLRSFVRKQKHSGRGLVHMVEYTLLYSCCYENEEREKILVAVFAF